MSIRIPPRAGEMCWYVVHDDIYLEPSKVIKCMVYLQILMNAVDKIQMTVSRVAPIHLEVMSVLALMVTSQIQVT